MAKTGTSLFYLVPIAGPALGVLELSADATLYTLGRHESCDLLLPPEADKVSRFHARFERVDGRWFVADNKSRWGTFLNGRKLEGESPVPLAEGDLIRVTPWTFAFSSQRSRPGMEARGDDTGQTMIRSSAIESYQGQRLAGDMLALLLEAAAALHSAENEAKLYELLMEYARRGAGLPNASVLKPVDASGRVEVVLTTVQEGQGAAYSKALLAAASAGNVAEFSSLENQDVSQSLAALNVASALCVPLMLNNTVAAYLYLDARGNRAVPFANALGPNASAFCVAMGKMASLALANLKRVEMERRQASFEKELSAGGEAQRFILPPRAGNFGRFSYVGESRPGRHVGGDFFDVIPLPGDKLAVALGDVAGKGIPASLLMSAAQGFLHHALIQCPTVGAAVSALNDFICPRCPDNKFLTLFVAVIDPANGTMDVVDAGHGYAFTRHQVNGFEQFPEAPNLPVGISADMVYESISYAAPAGGRLLLLSDGFIEQPSPDAERTQFEVTGVKGALAKPEAQADPVAALFAALIAHAGSEHLADDATAVLVSF